MVALVGLLLVAMVLGVVQGSTDVAVADLWLALWQSEQADPLASVVLWELRLPSVVLAALVGMALGLAGAEMQTVLNNPLASPFTLGVSSAAALGAALALVWQWTLPGVPVGWWVSVNAFVFALVAAGLLDVVARWRRFDSSGVVLFGIALVFACNAVVSLVQYTADADALQGLVYWTLGSLERAQGPTLALLAAVVLVSLLWSRRRAWALTALRLGDERAASLGVAVMRERRHALVRIALLAGLAVAAAGTIGFIGLVAPHIARRWFGEDHRYLLPGSALVGAILLVVAAWLSRRIVPDVTLPVGIVTALVGVPVFLWVVLYRMPRSQA